jgi:hypothetical protein
MDEDGYARWNQERQRFLAFARYFLENPRIPGVIKVAEIETTAAVLRQLLELVGPVKGVG